MTLPTEGQSGHLQKHADIDTLIAGHTSQIAAGDVTNPASAAGIALAATFVPRWVTATNYTAGDKVISPLGLVVSSKATHTSGVSYNPANWNLPTEVVAGSVRAAGGITTPGSVIQIGPESAMPSDVGTSGIIGGGASNYENAIGYTTANVNTATSNLTTPLTLTAPSGNWNWIWGGYDNVVNGWACQVQSYHSKVEAGANHVTISGGSIHIVDADVAYPTIGGGTGNRVTGNAGTIAGGTTNTAGSYSTVGGGQNNLASGSGASITGGSSNTVSANNGTVVGGTNNQATAISATAVGGQYNVASGVASVAMGRESVASGPAAIAMGREASSTFYGGVTQAAGKFTVVGDAQNTRVVARKQTTDATVTALLLDNISTRMVLPADTTWAFSAVIVARRADLNDESAGFKIEGVIDRNTTSAATTALVGTPVVTVLGRDSAAWTVTATASTSFGSLEINVTGEAGKTILWVATVELTCVTG